MPASVIAFSPAEIEILRHDAERARAEMSAAGLYGRCREEERYGFARDHARGNTWSTERAVRFARHIRAHLDRRRAAGGKR